MKTSEDFVMIKLFFGKHELAYGEIKGIWLFFLRWGMNFYYLSHGGYD